MLRSQPPPPHAFASSRGLSAIILSGGGARGAYEAGVLSYLFDEMPRMGARMPSFDVVCGTSVGAINAVYLAAHAATPGAGVRRLTDLWTGLELQQVIRFGVAEALRLPKVLWGGGPDVRGVFDVGPLVELVSKEIPWRSIARAINRGHLKALAVSATEIKTGRTAVFMQTHPDLPVPTRLGPRSHVVHGLIGPQHALASAAIPLVFPPVRVGSMLYCDGGLRQNTPMAPALHLGATRLLVVGLSQDVKGSVVPEGTAPITKAPGAPFLLGKLLNAFLLDHVESDIELLERLNELLEVGTSVYGPDFIDRLSREAVGRGMRGYRQIETLVIRPSEDIGRIAADHVRRGRVSGPLITRRLLSSLESEDSEEADLASYLLFDGGFCRRLIELGRADAHARRSELAAFFEDTQEPLPEF
ncbi:MAG: patatin-like phospholipase family protein [Deltaproteobacteria bacterium]|nr:patatin-like phospholipase family protein [Deltaproteobacteria bacterium]